MILPRVADASFRQGELPMGWSCCRGEIAFMSSCQGPPWWPDQGYLSTSLSHPDLGSCLLEVSAGTWKTGCVALAETSRCLQLARADSGTVQGSNPSGFHLGVADSASCPRCVRGQSRSFPSSSWLGHQHATGGLRSIAFSWWWLFYGARDGAQVLTLALRCSHGR